MSRIDLQYDARWWIAVDLDAEPGDWVPGIVRERWAAGGPAARVVQRYRMPRDPQVETVAESVVNLWVVEDDEGEPLVLIFSTAFEDLVEAAELRPLFDEVARTVALVN